MLQYVPHILLQNCNLLSYTEETLRNALKDKFAEASLQEQDGHYAAWLEKMANGIQRTTPEACHQQGQEKYKQTESGSRIKTGFMFYN
jgi:hypothetical protein